MRALAIALCLFLAATAANAATYQWTDKKGVVHYTDNFDRIPAEYQQRARELSVESPPTMKYEAPAAGTTPAPAQAMPSGRGDGELYCGRSAPAWRDEYRALRTERQQLADSLPDVENELLRRYNRLQRSLWDFDKNPPKKGDTKAEEEAAAKRAKQTSSGQYGRPSANRKAYQETLAQKEKATSRIAEIDRALMELENEAGRCGLPLQYRQ